MAAPGVTFSVKNGGLGVTPPLPGQTLLVVGTASSGVTDTLTPIGGLPQLKSTFVAGPLVDAAAAILQVASQVLCVNIFSGTWGSVTHTGGGAGAISLSGSPTANYQLKITISTTGLPGVGFFTYQLFSTGPTSIPIQIPAGLTYAIPNTGTTLTFTNASFTATDTYTAAVTAAVGTCGAVSQTGAGLATIVADASINPIDAYTVIFTVLQAGAVGTATVSYSVDGGRTSSVPLVTSSTFTIPGTGLVFDMSSGAGNFVAGNTYTFRTQGPGYSLTDVTNCYGIVVQNSTLWGGTFLVGQSSTAAALASLFSTMDSLMTTAFTNNRFTMAIIEAPPDSAQVPTDTALIAAMASLSSDFVCVGAGDAAYVSLASGTQMSRSAGLAVAVRFAQQPVGHDLGALEDGSCVGTAFLYRDEGATPGLDAARFSTLRQWFGTPGFYLENARMFTTPTSDFQYVQHRRVLNQACTAALPVLMLLVNAKIAIDPTTGFISSAAANKIQNDVEEKINAAIVQNGQASAAHCVVDTSHNILSDFTLPVAISIVPNGYSKFVTVSVQYTNPALVQAAQAAGGQRAA